MINYNFRNSFLILCLALFVSACGKKEGLCELAGADAALKTTLKSEMIKWQDIAAYTGIESFETTMNQVIDDLVIVENSYYRSLTDDSACHCKAIIRFDDHEVFLNTIRGPVEKVIAEEHPLNSKYLGMRRQMNYLENDGFEFFYIMGMDKDSTLVAFRQYPMPNEIQMDNAGGLLFDYMEYSVEK